MTDSAQSVSVRIGYTNHRGEFAVRVITPVSVWYGETVWHPEPQWFLKALDVEKQAERDFAFSGFGKSVVTEISDKAVEAATVAIHFCAEGADAKTLAEAALSAALPHLGAAGVAVRELEFSQSSGWPKVAETPFIFSYRIWADNGVWFGDEWVRGKHASSVAEAIEWAQADFEQRIRSALVPSPVQQEATAEPVASEAIAKLIEHHRLDCSRMLHGQCSTRRCLVRGGWEVGDGSGYSKATCEALETCRALETLSLAAPPSHDAELLAAAKAIEAWWIKEGMHEPGRIGAPYAMFALRAAITKIDAALAQEGGRSDG